MPEDHAFVGPTSSASARNDAAKSVVQALRYMLDRYSHDETIIISRRQAEALAAVLEDDDRVKKDKRVASVPNLVTPAQRVEESSSVLLRALIALVTKWRDDAAAGDTEEACFKTECADDLAVVLAQRATGSS